MKVLLVQGYLGPPPTSALVYPLGLAYVGTALVADGHTVRICDPNAHPEGLDHVREQLRADPPDLVGLSLRNLDSQEYRDFRYFYRYLGATIAAIREVCPGVPLLIGGAGFSSFPEKIMLAHRELDFGVYLEGEETAVELLRDLQQPARVPGVYYRRGDEVRFSGPRAFPSFDKLTWPRRDLVELAPYLAVGRSIGVQSQRGCPLGCAYCNYPTLNGGRLRRRSAADVVDELAHLVGEHGVREVTFADSVFDLDRGFAADVCRALVARGLDLRWSGYFEIHGFDETWFQLARQAGCQAFSFSPDGASDRTMRALGKRCREPDLARVLAIAARHPEVPFRVSVLCGTPGQDWRDVWRVLRLVFHTHLRLRNVTCFVNWTRLLPDTGLHRQAVEAGAVPAGVDLLPEQLADHRQLFYTAQGTPRLAGPLLRAGLRVAERIRDRRR